MKTDTKTHFLRQPAPSMFLCMLFLSFALTLSYPVRAAHGAERQSRRLGDITIEADSIAHSGSNFIATGNITLAVDQGEPILSVGDPPGGTASLLFDSGGTRLWTESPVLLGALGIRRHSGSTPKLWSLCRGNIRIDSTTMDPGNNTVRVKASDGGSTFDPLFGLPFAYVDDPPVFSATKDSVTLPDVQGSIPALGLPFPIQQGMILSREGSSMPPLHFNTLSAPLSAISVKKYGWPIPDFTVDLDFLQLDFEMSGFITIPGQIETFSGGKGEGGLGFAFGFKLDPFCINTIGGSLELTESHLCIFPMTQYNPVAAEWNALGFKISEICDPSKLSIQGNIGFHLVDIAYALDKFAAVTGLNLLEGNMAFTLAPAGGVAFSGDLALLHYLPLGDARVSIGWGRPGLSLEGNFYWWGGLFHGVQKGSLSYLNEKIEHTFLTDGRIEIPGNIPIIGGYQFADVKAQGLLRGSQSGIEKAWLEAGVSVHVVFFDYGVSVGVDFTNPAHPAFYVNGIRVPFSVSSAATGGKTVQSLRLDETVPFAYFLVRSEKGVPKASLIFPDGSEHPWETTPTFGPGELPPQAMVSRRENDAIGESYFLVGRPPLGEYSLEIENAQELGEFEIQLVLPDAPPEAAFVGLEEKITWNGTPLQVEWTVSDDFDPSPEISLYYGTREDGSDMQLLSNTLEDDGVFHWDIEGMKIPTGTYRLFVAASDGNNPRTIVRSGGTVTVRHPDAPAAPVLSNTHVFPGDGFVEVLWDPVDGAREYIVEVHDERNSVMETHRVRSVLFSEKNRESGQYSAVVEGLRNGKMYGISITARNEEGIESLPGNTINFIPNGPFNTSGNPDLVFDGNGTSITRGIDGTCIVAAEIRNRGEFSSTGGSVAVHPGTLTHGTLIGSIPLPPIEPGSSTTVRCEFPLSKLTQAPVFNDQWAVFLCLEDVLPAELNRSNNVIVRYLSAETGESGGCGVTSGIGLSHAALFFLPLWLLAGWKWRNRRK